MTDDLSKGNDLFNVIKRGHLWDPENIKNTLEQVIFARHFSRSASYGIRTDDDDKYYFVYENQCYLFIHDKLIELRSDRDNVFSSYQTIEYPIKTIADIENAYERFLSMTMEDES